MNDYILFRKSWVITEEEETQGLTVIFVVIASYHAPVERQRRVKMSSDPLMVRPAHHEQIPGPFILSKSKDERAIFIAAKQSNLA